LNQVVCFCGRVCVCVHLWYVLRFESGCVCVYVHVCVCIYATFCALILGVCVCMCICVCIYATFCVLNQVVCVCVCVYEQLVFFSWLKRRGWNARYAPTNVVCIHVLDIYIYIYTHAHTYTFASNPSHIIMYVIIHT
jgi:hypothetical protein